MSIPFSERSRAWAELLRLPNLLTVPGDPVAGYLLALFVGGAALDLRALAASAVAALLLYVSGLVMNDCVDLRIDLEERPGRPIPSGRVSCGEAWAIAVLALLSGTIVGVLAGATLLAPTLAALVVAYNLILKRSAVLGPIALGGCRAASLLLGAEACRSELGVNACAAAIMIFLYILAVSRIAHDEMSEDPPVRLRQLPLLAIALAAPLLATRIETLSGALAAAVAALLFVVQHTRAAGLVARRTIPPAIGIWIRNLILIQTALCALAAPQAWMTLPLFLMWLLAERLGRRVASS